jgi:hypothetical protein
LRFFLGVNISFNQVYQQKYLEILSVTRFKNKSERKNVSKAHTLFCEPDFSGLAVTIFAPESEC